MKSYPERILRLVRQKAGCLPEDSSKDAAIYKIKRKDLLDILLNVGGSLGCKAQLANKKNQNPCASNCPKRSVGCHGICIDYFLWKLVKDVKTYENRKFMANEMLSGYMKEHYSRLNKRPITGKRRYH